MLDQKRLRCWKIERIINGTGEPRREGINVGDPIDLQSKLLQLGTAPPLAVDPEHLLIRAETEAEEDTMEFPSSPEVITVAPDVYTLLQDRFDGHIPGCNNKVPIKGMDMTLQASPMDIEAFRHFTEDYEEEFFPSGRAERIGKMSHSVWTKCR